MEQGRFDEAEALFQQAIAAEKNTFDAWIGLARLNLLKENFRGRGRFCAPQLRIDERFQPG